MNNYRLTIQYDGSRYKGWQRLGGGESTIQEKLEHVLSELIGDEVELIGCSRTDAGVHAIAQVANIKIEKEIDANQIKDYVNRYLPQDICVTEVAEVSEDFHARYNAKDKTYLYKIWNKEYCNPFMRKYSMYVQERLDLIEMRKAAAYFIGMHDFTAFSNAKSKKKSMEREIYEINFEEKDGMLNIRLCGNGFLYNMARWIVGTLIDVGLGRRKASMIPAMLLEKDRAKTGNLAEACGLYLEKINY
jgi:tRNA pseudouridine38-40 synthase